MRVLLSALLVTTVAAATLPATAPAPAPTAEIELPHPCVEKVPEGGDPSEYAICAEHPLGHETPEPAGDVVVDGEVDDECGPLGRTEVPAGEDPANYPKCRDHSESERPEPVDEDKQIESARLAERGTTPANSLLKARAEKAKLNERACWYGAELYNCSKKGWCYSYCGRMDSGKWCWLGVDRGKGDWARCTSRAQCNWKSMELDCKGRCSCY